MSPVIPCSPAMPARTRPSHASCMATSIRYSTRRSRKNPAIAACPSMLSPMTLRVSYDMGLCHPARQALVPVQQFARRNRVGIRPAGVVDHRGVTRRRLHCRRRALRQPKPRGECDQCLRMSLFRDASPYSGGDADCASSSCSKGAARIERETRDGLRSDWNSI